MIDINHLTRFDARLVNWFEVMTTKTTNNIIKHFQEENKSY